MRFRTSALGSVLDLLAPTECVNCGLPGHTMCLTCVVRFQQPASRRVLVDADGGFETWAAGDYAAVFRSALLEFKRRGTRSLLRPLVKCATAAIAVWCGGPAGSGPSLIVPLHSGRATFRAAGVDVPLLLARHACRRLRRSGVRIAIADQLRASWMPASQKALGAAERFGNVRGSLTVRPGPMLVLPCIVFDDVVTTGATMLEARRVLREAGANVLGGACVSAVTPQGGDAMRARGAWGR